MLSPQPRCSQPTAQKRLAWEAVRQHKVTGQSLAQITREFGMDRRTIRTDLALDHPPVYSPRRPRPTLLMPHLPSRHERWIQGCHHARRLSQDLVPRGYQGCESQVRKTAGPWRGVQEASPPLQGRSLPWLVRRPAGQLTDSERATLTQSWPVNPLLACGYQLKERFQTLMAARALAAFDDGLHDADASALASLQAVAQGFGDDAAAIAAAFTTPWSTGQCEGQIGRVKLIKRVGYGRAKLDVLRQRILHRMVAPATRVSRARQVQPQVAASRKPPARRT